MRKAQCHQWRVLVSIGIKNVNEAGQGGYHNLGGWHGLAEALLESCVVELLLLGLITHYEDFPEDQVTSGDELA